MTYISDWQVSISQGSRYCVKMVYSGVVKIVKICIDFQTKLQFLMIVVKFIEIAKTYYRTKSSNIAQIKINKIWKDL